MNGNGINGSGTTQPVSINPMQAAAYAIQFMERAMYNHAERQQFDIGYSLLQAIANGNVILAPPPALNANPEPEGKVDER